MVNFDYFGFLDPDQSAGHGFCQNCVKRRSETGHRCKEEKAPGRQVTVGQRTKGYRALGSPAARVYPSHNRPVAAGRLSRPTRGSKVRARIGAASPSLGLSLCRATPIKILETLARQVGRYWPHMTLDAPYSRYVLGEQNECAPFVVGQVGRPQMDHAVLNRDIPR